MKQITYDDIVVRLQQSHFYPAKIKKVGRKSEKIIGLSVDAIGILMESKTERIKNILSEEGIEARVIPQKNLGYIEIVKI